MAITSARPTSAGLALCTVLILLLALLAPRSAVADTVATEDPNEAAAGWLVTALTDDPAVGGEFGPSAGPTIDVLFALAAAGVAAETIEAVADWLESEAAVYTQGEGFDAEDAAYAGATAKLALAMLVVDRDPTDAGGIDLLEQLIALEGADGEAAGRFFDGGDLGDFSTPLTQSLALLALTRAADVAPSDAAVEVLLDQACPDGGFPDSFGAAEDADTCASAVDTTAVVIQALEAVGEQQIAEEAVAWLLEVQADDGSFGSEDGQNTNSTGLAAAALTLFGEDAAAERAVVWMQDLQVGCDGEQPGAVPFGAEEPGSLELATAQAVLGAVGTPLLELDGTTASDVVPVLDCDGEDVAAPEDGQGPAADTEDADDEVDEEAAAEDDEPFDDEAAAAPGDADEGWSPNWIAILLAALLAAGVAYLVQRRRAGDGASSDATW